MYAQIWIVGHIKVLIPEFGSILIKVVANSYNGYNGGLSSRYFFVSPEIAKKFITRYATCFTDNDEEAFLAVQNKMEDYFGVYIYNRDQK